jgi:beclin 1
MAAAQKLFRLANEMTDMDFPMCSDCLDILFEEYEAMGKREAKEAAAHQEFLAHFQQTVSISLTEEELVAQIGHLEEEERKLQQVLHDVEQERLATAAQMEAIQFENKKLDLLEERYWAEYNRFMTESAEFEEKSECLQAKLAVASKHLEALQRTDVLNDVFHIWHDGHFGTINDLRLGRLPSQPVEWPEINAGGRESLRQILCFLCFLSLSPFLLSSFLFLSLFLYFLKL